MHLVPLYQGLVRLTEEVACGDKRFGQRNVTHLVRALGFAERRCAIAGCSASFDI
jgi:hypothetical protein